MGQDLGRTNTCPVGFRYASPKSAQIGLKTWESRLQITRNMLVRQGKLGTSCMVND